MANSLANAGLEPGDRLAMPSQNSIEYATFYYGAFECAAGVRVHLQRRRREDADRRQGLRRGGRRHPRRAQERRALRRDRSGELGGFERPPSVDFAEALPRNASGKVLKKDLRERFWAGQERRVAGV